MGSLPKRFATSDRYRPPASTFAQIEPCLNYA
jgi:hypothetical protein